MAAAVSYRYKRPEVEQPSGETSAMALPRQARSTDIVGAFSTGYGYDKKMECPEGIPVEQAIFGALAAFAAAFGFLFRAVTMATATGRRKKRALASAEDAPLLDTLHGKVSDVLWMGRW